jgi:hypothetical protein
MVKSAQIRALPHSRLKKIGWFILLFFQLNIGYRSNKVVAFEQSNLSELERPQISYSEYIKTPFYTSKELKSRVSPLLSESVAWHPIEQRVRPTQSFHPTEQIVSGADVPLQLPDPAIDSIHAADLLAAAPDNFNPGLQTPPLVIPSAVENESPSPVPSLNERSNLQLNFRNDTDNYGKLNRFLEPTARFHLANGDTLRIRTGYNYFNQLAVESVINIPLQIGWETQINTVRLDIAAGLDFFDHLPTAVNFNASAAFPLSPHATLTAVIEQEPYKFNAETLNNNITALRFGANLYWQIAPQTSLFSLLRFGMYNDHNRELQSFSRIEHRIDNFFVAANLFTWNYADDVEQTSGYFSPSSFLVYTGEVGWENSVSDDLSCRLAATLGRQQLERETSLATRLSVRCNLQINENLSANLGYTFSDVRRSVVNNDSYQNHVIEGQLQFSF